MTRVDAENRNLAVAHPRRGAQKRAVAADAYHHVGRHLAWGDNLVGGEVGDKSAEIGEKVTLHFDKSPGGFECAKKRADFVHFVVLALVSEDCYFHIIYTFCLSYVGK